MRALVVNHAVELGGAELTLLDLLAHRPPDVVVTLAVPSDGPLARRARALGVEVVLAGPGAQALAYRRRDTSLSPAQGIRAAAGLMQGAGALVRLAARHDVVITNSTKAHLYGGAAARLARRPCVWRLHDVVDAAGFSAPVRALLLGAARVLPRRVVAVSEAAAAPLRKVRAQVTVRHNGVATGRVLAAADARAQVRAELGLPAGAFVLLMLGRLTPLKGAEVLFDALRTLPDVRAVVAGEATFAEVEDYGERLRAHAAPLEGRVVFAGFRDDVGALLAASDVLVHPSVRPDSLPTAVLEALAAGVPVVASTSGGAQEILADEQGGLLVPAADSAALAAAVERLRSDSALRARLARAAQKRARDFELAPCAAGIWQALLGDAG